EHALARGIVIADTKFEFGQDGKGRLMLADEAFTPDSSRFWPADEYAPGAPQPSFDKQFVRDYCESLGWDKTYPGPELPEEVVAVAFPGSNDDRDAAWALAAAGADPVLVWHGEPELPEVGAVVLPGGFSYGDYLRCGAIARFAPVMAAVEAFAADGGPVLGICNGFQILCEAGLLPGVLRPNVSLRFVCR